MRLGKTKSKNYVFHLYLRSPFTIFAAAKNKKTMRDRKQTRDVYRVTIAGSVANMLLVVFKFVAGIVGHSAAMTADAIHSLSDLITDLVVLLSVRIAGRPSDKSHDYGHGKYETLATLVIGVALLIVGLSVGWTALCSVWRVINGAVLSSPGMISLWAALVSVAVKEVVFRVTIRVGRATGSPAVVANAWHHRSDALSSAGTALGIGGAIFMGERWRVLDPLSAIVVSIFIIKVSVELLRPCLDDLTECSLPDEVEQSIADVVMAEPEVSGLHNLRTRRIGNRYAIEMHVRMDGSTTLYDAHTHASHIERVLKDMYGEDTHVGIHVEPIKKDGHYVCPSRD